jgi:hypothetical protein
MSVSRGALLARSLQLEPVRPGKGAQLVTSAQQFIHVLRAGVRGNAKYGHATRQPVFRPGIHRRHLVRRHLVRTFAFSPPGSRTGGGQRPHHAAMRAFGYRSPAEVIGAVAGACGS